MNKEAFEKIPIEWGYLLKDIKGIWARKISV